MVKIPGVIKTTAGAAIASAATVDLSTATGNSLHITGSTGPITSFGTVAASVIFTLIFDSTPTITHNATSLILPTGANIVAEAGDTMILRSEGSGNWKCIAYTRADGYALVETAVNLTPYALNGQTVTAGEILYANDIVYPTAADTMERVRPTSFASNSATFTESSGGSPKKILKIDATRTLHVGGGYIAASLAFNSNIGTLNAGETDMSYGSSYTAGGVSTLFFDVCQFDTYKFLALYYETTGSAVKAVVLDCSSSGSTITNGSVVSINTSNTSSQVSCAKLDSSRVAIIYQSSADSKKYIQILSISGTTITTNTQVELDAGTNNGMVVSLEYLTTNTLLCVYAADNTDTLVAKIITVSGTVPTINGSNTLDATSADYNIGKIAVISSTKAAIVYSESSNTDTYAAILTISGTTVTKGSNLTLSTVEGFNNSYGNIIAISSTVLLTATLESTTALKWHLLYVDGTTITSTTTVSIAVGVLTYASAWVCKFKPFKYLSSSGEQYTYVTLGDNVIKRVGVMQENVADAAAGSMFYRFRPVASYSGLTPGSTYYIDDNATANTDSSTLSTKLGTAIDTTTILVE